VKGRSEVYGLRMNLIQSSSSLRHGCVNFYKGIETCLIWDYEVRFPSIGSARWWRRNFGYFFLGFVAFLAVLPPTLTRSLEVLCGYRRVWPVGAVSRVSAWGMNLPQDRLIL
jgi:hypothetical protein